MLGPKFSFSALQELHCMHVQDTGASADCSWEGGGHKSLSEYWLKHCTYLFEWKSQEKYNV